MKSTDKGARPVLMDSKLIGRVVDGVRVPYTFPVRSHMRIREHIRTLRRDGCRGEPTCYTRELLTAADELEQLLMELDGEHGYVLEEEDEHDQMV